MTHTDSLHYTIQKAAKDAGLEPVEFDKPLKSVGAYYRLRKEVAPKNLVERHAAIGWGCATLVEYFEKELWAIKSLSITNEKDKITIEAIVYATMLTFNENHTETLDDTMVGDRVKTDRHGDISTMRRHSSIGIVWNG